MLLTTGADLSNDSMAGNAYANSRPFAAFDFISAIRKSVQPRAARGWQPIIVPVGSAFVWALQSFRQIPAPQLFASLFPGNIGIGKSGFAKIPLSSVFDEWARTHVTVRTGT